MPIHQAPNCSLSMQHPYLYGHPHHPASSQPCHTATPCSLYYHATSTPCQLPLRAPPSLAFARPEQRLRLPAHHQPPYALLHQLVTRTHARAFACIPRQASPSPAARVTYPPRQIPHHHVAHMLATAPQTRYRLLPCPPATTHSRATTQQAASSKQQKCSRLATVACLSFASSPLAVGSLRRLVCHQRCITTRGSPPPRLDMW